MSRPLRIEFENAVYHVMNRGIRHSTIFHEEIFYKDFLNCLVEAHQKFNLQILAYCLMGNHYHLLVKTPYANLSRCMRHIDGVYTQRHNRLLGRDGPIFRGRYKAILVDIESYLLQVSRYIHRNPIETNPPLVNTIEDYPWSSYSAYIDNMPCPQWLLRNEILSILNPERRFAAYKEYVSQSNNQELLNFYSNKKILSILGNNTFAENARNYQKTHLIETPQYVLKKFIPMDAIIDRVCFHYKILPEELLQTKRGARNKNVPRKIAIYLCNLMSGEKLITIAKKFHVNHYTTISQTTRITKKILTENEELTRDINIIIQDLTPSKLTEQKISFS